MNTKALNSLADIICRAEEAGKRTPMGIAFAIDAAQRHMSPETAAELERLRTERDRYRTAWRMARTRAISTGGAADRYAARARDAQEALQHMLFAVIASQLGRKAATDEIAALKAERHTTNEALDDAVQALRATSATPSGKCGRELSTGKPCPDHPRPETPPLTVFRASHDSIVMDLYATREAARKHCETELRREVGDEVFLGWVPDHGGDDAPEELCTGEDVICSGYVVTPLEVASEYDPDADE